MEDVCGDEDHDNDGNEDCDDVDDEDVGEEDVHGDEDRNQIITTCTSVSTVNR